jgi:DtxR family Mn-dependent transcriptional regulator
MLSHTEENYLKAIYNLYKTPNKNISTSEIAEKLNTAPATVTDMMQKLAEKKLIKYEKYKGVGLSKSGATIAALIVRKHRIWETFLVNTLGFKWDEVHPMAEQLEHIQSDELINRIDQHLNYPKMDPHGDPIPDKNGIMPTLKTKPLSDCFINNTVTVISMADQSTPFLKLIEHFKIELGSKINVIDKLVFDNSMEIKVDNDKSLMISQLVACKIIVK